MPKNPNISRYINVEKRHFSIVFSQVLHRLREKSGLKLHELSKITGVHQSSLCRYEVAGNASIPLHEMKNSDISGIIQKIRLPDVFITFKIAQAYGLTVDELMELCVKLVEAARELGKHGEEEQGDEEVVGRGVDRQAQKGEGGESEPEEAG